MRKKNKESDKMIYIYIMYIKKKEKCCDAKKKRKNKRKIEQIILFLCDLVFFKYDLLLSIVSCA